MKHLLSAVLLFSVFSLKSFSQEPTDSLPVDPGNQSESYEAGYAAGAAAAKDLKLP